MNAFWLTLTSVCLITVSSLGYTQEQNKLQQLAQHKWFSGTQTCESAAPAIETYKYSENTYILRQNKCLHYEAPFIYLLIGNHKALVLDTGATADEAKFPLAKTINKIIQSHQKKSGKNIELIVAHSHSHSDHIAGDAQFEQYNNTQIIKPKNLSALTHAFNFKKWPETVSEINLGNRNLTIIPAPGHQTEAIVIYDHNTQWLLTGDTFYPGRLYVKNWESYKQSISRLTSFSISNNVSAILGAHIEMSSTAGIDYKMGSKYHPNEASLLLHTQDLLTLNNALHTIGNTPKKLTLDKFIIFPIK